MNEVTFKIEQYIGVISAKKDGWNKELNLVSWNGGETKYDIREWSEDHTKMSRGVTLTPDEMHRIAKMIEGRV